MYFIIKNRFWKFGPIPITTANLAWLGYLITLWSVFVKCGRRVTLQINHCEVWEKGTLQINHCEVWEKGYTSDQPLWSVGEGLYFRSTIVKCGRRVHFRLTIVKCGRRVPFRLTCIVKCRRKIIQPGKYYQIYFINFKTLIPILDPIRSFLEKNISLPFI